MSADARVAVHEACNRADEAKRAAHTLGNAGLHRDAVSRGYYAAYHYLRAALHARGLETRTHTGAFQLFHREFVKTGILTRVPGWQLAALQRSREMADYDTFTAFTAEEVGTLLDIVNTFAEDVLAWLRRDGFLPS